jgi:hypothetical protein
MKTLRNLIWRLLGPPPARGSVVRIDGKALARTVRVANGQEARR